jgi:hypothetical protein
MDKGVSRGQRGGSPTVVFLSVLDRSSDKHRDKSYLTYQSCDCPVYVTTGYRMDDRGLGDRVPVV